MTTFTNKPVNDHTANARYGAMVRGKAISKAWIRRHFDSDTIPEKAMRPPTKPVSNVRTHTSAR